MFALRRQGSGGDFLPLEQHRVVAISCVLRSRDGLTVWSLGEPGTPEEELVQRFFDGIEKYSPDLVSWNGSGFDLPVLHYRALLHGVQAPRFWETGDEDRRSATTTTSAAITGATPTSWTCCPPSRAAGARSLANMAMLLGLPGKLGFDGSQVWEAFQAGDLAGIRATARPTCSTPSSSGCASRNCAPRSVASSTPKSSRASRTTCGPPPSRTSRSTCGLGGGCLSAANAAGDRDGGGPHARR